MGYSGFNSSMFFGKENFHEMYTFTLDHYKVFTFIY